MMTEEMKQARIESLTFRLKTLDLLEEAGMHFDVVDRDSYRIALAALTQPASPALRLPDAKETQYVYHGGSGAFQAGKESGFNECIAEVKRLNAPHTAPIEPICATGGAEWVKCSERMPEETEVFGGDDFSPEVLTINQYGEQWVGKTHWGKWVHTKHSDCIVLAWMPLPAAPEEQDGD